ncbi:MAG: zf-HC2 domain-containing protein [Pirellulaceae bacterium]|nr:zf-HC2 domain-containing protein [Pirellulaceae bacterium]
MKCHEFENRLNDLLDERLAPESDARLVAHAQGCEVCGQLLQGQRALLAGLRPFPGPALRAEFADEVVVASLAPGADVEFAPREPATRWWVFALVATAATLLLTFGIGRAISRNRAQRDQIVKQNEGSPPSQSPRGMAIVTPRRGGSAAPSPPLSGRRYAAFGPQIGSFAATLPAAVEHFDEVERYAPGLRPLRISFVMLFDTLRRAIPGWQDHSSETGPALKEEPTSHPDLALWA